MGIGAYTGNGYRLKAARATGFGTGTHETLEPLRMEMNRPRERFSALPYIRLQNPAAPVPNPRAGALKCACTTTGPDRVPAAIHMMF